jgi:hypothetical protein
MSAVQNLKRSCASSRRRLWREPVCRLSRQTTTRAILDQALAEMRADEAGAAGDQDGERRLLRHVRPRRLKAGNGRKPGLAQQRLEFEGAVPGGVGAEDPRARPRRSGGAPGRRGERRAAASGRLPRGDLVVRVRAGSSMPSQTSEMIGARRRRPRTAGRWGCSRRRHVGAGDVQGEAAGAIEGRMIGGADVIDPLDIVRPGDVVGILRPGHAELQVRRAAGGLQQQALQIGCRSSL